MQQHIDFLMEISVLKIQTWQFDGKPAYKDCFSKRPNTREISPSHLLLSHV